MSNLNNQQNAERAIETAAISGLAAASKTPFRTAFKITLGIGLARFLMFVGIVATIVAAYKITH